MKIAVIGPVHPYRGGIAHHTALLVQNLQAAGHTVEMISFRRQYPEWLYPGVTDQDTSKQSIHTDADYLLDPLYPWTWLHTVIRIKRNKPDLVVIPWWTTFWAPAYAVIALLLRQSQVRVKYLIHNVVPHEKRFFDRWLSRLALSLADSFIVQTEKEAARLRAILPKAVYVVTPHPIYNMFVSPLINRDEARMKLQLPVSAPLVLFFGIVRPYKGLRYLLQAFRLLHAQQSAAHLVIAGEFWEPLQEYQLLIKDLRIASRVHIFNHYIPNEDIPLFFTAADLFVAPYIDGTQSGSTKLAMGFALPIVLTRCILDESLVDRDDVWIAEERDEQSLALAINNALKKGVGSPSQPPSDDWEKMVRAVESL